MVLHRFSKTAEDVSTAYQQCSVFKQGKDSRVLIDKYARKIMIFLRKVITIFQIDEILIKDCSLYNKGGYS